MDLDRKIDLKDVAKRAASFFTFLAVRFNPRDKVPTHHAQYYRDTLVPHSEPFDPIRAAIQPAKPVPQGAVASTGRQSQPVRGPFATGVRDTTGVSPCSGSLRYTYCVATGQWVWVSSVSGSIGHTFHSGS